MTLPAIGNQPTPPATLLGETGSYGLHSVSWGNVRKALRKLGGVPARTTNSHGSALIRMPTGAQISTGKDSEAHTKVLGDGIRQLMDEVRRAGLEPALMLAVLDNTGCAWTAKPPVVSDLAVYLRQQGVPVNGVSRWSEALKGFGVWLAKRNPTPATKSAEKPAEKPADRYPFDTAKLLDLADLKGDARARASIWLGNAMSRTHTPDFIAKLLDSGEALRDTSTGRTVNRYTEHAALLIAEEAQRRYAPKPEPTKEEPVTIATPEIPAVRPTAAPQAPAEEPQTGLAHALLALCRHHAAAPVFEGLTLDVNATVIALAAQLKRNNRLA